MAAYVTLADAAKVYRVTEATLRRWAEQDGWRMVESQPPRYRLADVQAGYDRRTRPARVKAHLERRYAWLLPATGTGTA